jgi:hypothetical protein
LIRRPDTSNPATNPVYSYPVGGKTPYSTFTITGGTIYVGSGQTLTIQGAVQDNMHIKPNEIVVAEGGTLVIEGGSYLNVETTIYVEGTLRLNAGANMAGQAFVSGKGVVEVNGAVSWKADDSAPATPRTGLIVANGGTINLNASCNLTSNIYVLAGGKLNILNSAAVTGDIKCVGTVTFPSGVTSFTLNRPAVMLDDPLTSENESESQYHGMFIYNDPVSGTGTLVIENTNSPPAVIGTSGKIHTFTGFPAIVGALASDIFCSKHDTGNNVCKHWGAIGEVWMPQAATPRASFGGP